MRSVRRDSLGLAVVAAFAIAQPLFDLGGRGAQFFVAQRARPLDLFLLALTLIAVPALLLAAATALAERLGDDARRRWVAAAMTVLAALVALPLLNRVAALPSAVVIILALAAGAGWARLYTRARAARLFLLVLAPALFLFPLFFLLRGDVRPLVAPTPLPRIEPRPVLASDDDTPVVLVVFDEFPLPALLDERRLIDPIRYPHFAALAEDAIFFRNATAVHNYSRHAIPALLTGRYPASGAPPTATWSAHPENLFTWFGDDVEIFALEGWTELCPDDFNRLKTAATPAVGERWRGIAGGLGRAYLHAVVPPRLATRLPPMGLGGRGGATTERRDPFFGALDELVPRDRPALYFLHVLLPHFPLEYFPSGRRYNDPWLIPGWVNPTDGAEVWADDAELVTYAYHRLLLQVAAVDDLLGVLVDRLRVAGIYDRALLVVTSDHGVSYRAGRARRGVPGEDMRAELMPVPLLIKLPGQRAGELRDDNAETVDVLPTIADVFGLEVPWSIDGRSLLAGEPRPTKRFLVLDSSRDHDEIQTWPAAEVGERWRVHDRWLGIFGSGRTRPDGLYRFGRHRGLIGRPLEELTVTAAGGLRAIWDEDGTLADVDLEAPVLPAHVNATVQAEGGGTVPRYWAVALDGVVRAVAPTHSTRDERTRFAALVPESALRPGDNRLDAFAIVDGEDGVELRPASAFAAADVARRAFESLPDVLLLRDARRGFAGLEAEVGEVTVTAGELRVEADSPPSLRLDVAAAAGRERVALRVELESPIATELCALYQTAGERRFWWTRMRCRPLRPGPNEVYLDFGDARLDGELRLDLGKRPGVYRLRALELRAAAAGTDLR